jgi:RNA-binding protein NOB1
MTSAKSVHTVILDAGPIIKGDPSVSSLLAQSEQLVTLPSVIQEIKDEATRSRLQTTLLPFLVLKVPKESSVKVIADFARKTGDLAVLSRVDTHLLALAYDLECERNGGDWRLRKTPGEKRISGRNQEASIPEQSTSETMNEGEHSEAGAHRTPMTPSERNPCSDTSEEHFDLRRDVTALPAQEEVNDLLREVQADETASTIAELPGTDSQVDNILASINALQMSDVSNDDDSSSSDSEGWITPSNLKKKQAEDATGNTSSIPEPKVLQVVMTSPHDILVKIVLTPPQALLTSDFAMQNVALQMNLNLLSPSLNRVKHIKTFVLRCHGM